MSTQDDVFQLVLVAHHSASTVELLKALLEPEGFTVFCAYNGRSALQFSRQHHPILLLLDHALPLLDGLELCRILRREDELSAIFILSDQTDELGKLLAFAAGADDCLIHPYHPRELLARIKAVLRRTRQQRSKEHSILRAGPLELDTEQRQLRAGSESIALTALEYELLSTLMQHPGTVFSRVQLLELLQSFQHTLPFDRAVDIHISNIRRKLIPFMGDTVSIETVRGVGYRLNVPDTELPVSAQPASLEQKQLALAAFNLAPFSLLVIAANRTIVLYNEAARHLCGWSEDQVVEQAKCFSLLSCHNADGKLLCQEECALHTLLLNRRNNLTAHYCIMLKSGHKMPVVAQYTDLGDFGAGSNYTLLAIQPEEAAQ